MSLPCILPIPIHSTQNVLFTCYLCVIYALLTQFLSLFFHLFYSLTSFYISSFYLLCQKRKKKFQKPEFEFERFSLLGSQNRRSETWKSCVLVKTHSEFVVCLFGSCSSSNSVLMHTSVPPTLTPSFLLLLFLSSPLFSSPRHRTSTLQKVSGFYGEPPLDLLTRPSGLSMVSCPPHHACPWPLFSEWLLSSATF